MTKSRRRDLGTMATSEKQTNPCTGHVLRYRTDVASNETDP